MAQQGVQLDLQDQLRCSICLDVLKGPVTLPCGHSYCGRCIEEYWNQDDQRGRYSCPQCRDTFNPRPVLKKNTMLAEVVEGLKKTPTTGLRDVPPDHHHYYAGPGDVACDYCTTGRKVKAMKTCLQCLVSYCDAHLQPHRRYPALKDHMLVVASAELRGSGGHDAIAAVAQRVARRKELVAASRLRSIRQRIQEREEDVRVLQREVESINHCADRAVEDSDAIFTELVYSMETSMERRRWEARELIREQQEQEVSVAEELRRRVEQEVAELRNNMLLFTALFVFCFFGLFFLLFGVVAIL